MLFSSSTSLHVRSYCGSCKYGTLVVSSSNRLLCALGWGSMNSQPNSSCTFHCGTGYAMVETLCSSLSFSYHELRNLLAKSTCFRFQINLFTHWVEIQRFAGTWCADMLCPLTLVRLFVTVEPAARLLVVAKSIDKNWKMLDHGGHRTV